MNTFGLKLALRELRAGWRQLFFFFLSLAVGVCAIVTLRSAIQNINYALASEARLLLTGDVQVESTRPWNQRSLDAINQIAQTPLVQGRAEIVEAAAMARPTDANREGTSMVELKGVDPGFPLVGDFTLEQGKAFDYELLQNRGAVVSPLLLQKLNIGLGDNIEIGDTSFQVRGVIGHEPGGGGFRIGPAVFIAKAALEETGLAGFAGRARRKILFTTPEGKADTLVLQLRAALKNELVTVRSYKNSQEDISEQFARAENYLSLAGLTILALGGIGISSVTRLLIEQQKKTIAVLKCVGGSGRMLALAYFSQATALGISGSLVGIVLAVASMRAIEQFLSSSLPRNMNYHLRPGAVLQGIALGIAISALFSIVPLMALRRIKPYILLRPDEASRGSSFDRAQVIASILLGVVLLLIASWQGGSLKTGLYFTVGITAIAAILYLVSILLVRVARITHLNAPFAVRQGINNLYRPGNQTRLSIMVIGMGIFLVFTVQSLKANLLQEFDVRQAKLPGIYVIDIQKDQKAGVEQLVAASSGVKPTLIPTVRARITAVNGREIDLQNMEMRRDRGMLGREYVVTYRPTLDPDETIVAGKFWDPAPSPIPEVSLEEGMRGMASIDVGSTITFDILGRRLDARVTGMRHIDWRHARTGFMILFRPGTLEDAPQMYVGAIEGLQDQASRTRFERNLLDKFPAVSLIDVTEVMEAVKRILNNAALAASFVSSFVLATGILILVGSIGMTRFQHLHEMAVLRTLGARRITLVMMLLAEYGALGLIAGVVGIFGATILSYVISRFLFEIDWSLPALVSVTGILSSVLLVTVAGALASMDSLYYKPLRVLRSNS